LGERRSRVAHSDSSKKGGLSKEKGPENALNLVERGKKRKEKTEKNRLGRTRVRSQTKKKRGRREKEINEDKKTLPWVTGGSQKGSVGKTRTNQEMTSEEKKGKKKGKTRA